VNNDAPRLGDFDACDFESSIVGDLDPSKALAVGGFDARRFFIAAKVSGSRP